MWLANKRIKNDLSRVYRLTLTVRGSTLVVRVSDVYNTARGTIFLMVVDP